MIDFPAAANSNFKRITIYIGGYYAYNAADYADDSDNYKQELKELPAEYLCYAGKHRRAARKYYRKYGKRCHELELACNVRIAVFKIIEQLAQRLEYRLARVACRGHFCAYPVYTYADYRHHEHSERDEYEHKTYRSSSLFNSFSHKYVLLIWRIALIAKSSSLCSIITLKNRLVNNGFINNLLTILQFMPNFKQFLPILAKNYDISTANYNYNYFITHFAALPPISANNALINARASRAQAI